MYKRGFVILPILVIIGIIAVIGVIILNKNDEISSQKKPSNYQVEIETQPVTPPIVETFTPTLIPENAEPQVVGHTLTTPLMKYYDGSTRTITFTKLPGWEFKNYVFNICTDLGAPCEYQLHINNALSPEYTLWYGHVSEFASCMYDLSQPDEEGYKARVESYKTYQTGFGTIRIGKAESSDQLVVCQKNVSYITNKTTDWVNLTEVQTIRIHTPAIYDQSIVDEMIQMITKTRVVITK